MGILQARILEWVAAPSSNLPNPRIESGLPHCREILYHLSHQGSPVRSAAAKSLQSCPTLCDPIDSSPPGSPIPGILQARILEWVAISFSNAWKWKAKVKSLSHVRLLATPWTAAYQAPPPMGFSRQEYWSGLPLPSLHVRYKLLLLNCDNPMSLLPPLPLSADEETKALKSKVESPQGSPRILEWVAYPFSRGSFQPRNWTGVSCIAGGFFTCWAAKETPLLRGLALYWEGASSPSITCYIWTQRDVGWVWGSFSRPGIVVTKQSKKYIPFTMQATRKGFLPCLE